MEIRNKLVNWRRRRRRRRRDLTDWAAVRDGGGQWNELGPRDNDDVDDVIIGCHARRRLDQDLAVVFVYSSPAARPPARRGRIYCVLAVTATDRCSKCPAALVSSRRGRHCAVTCPSTPCTTVQARNQVGGG